MSKVDPKDLAEGIAPLHEVDLEWVARGVALYVKHLERHAAEAQELGREAEATKGQRDADWFKLDLVTPIIGDDEGDGITGRLEVQNRHLQAIHHGLGMLVKNMRAARGTLKPIGSRVARTIEKLEEAANYVEGQLRPRFAAQGDLLAGGSPPPPDDLDDGRVPKASEVSSLKKLAEAEAES